MLSFVDQFSSYIYIVNVLAFMYSFINSFRKLVIIDNTELSNVKLENSCLVTILASLDPFLDSVEILYVGGRLRNSCFSIDKKHPIIILAKSHFVRLCVRYIYRVLSRHWKLFLSIFGG